MHSKRTDRSDQCKQLRWSTVSCIMDIYVPYLLSARSVIQSSSCTAFTGFRSSKFAQIMYRTGKDLNVGLKKVDGVLTELQNQFYSHLSSSP